MRFSPKWPTIIVTALYSFAFLFILAYGAIHILDNRWIWASGKYNPALLCMLSGGFGGLLYTIRALYINVCVKSSWDPSWVLWYFLRPAVSIMSGLVSYLFFVTGLLIFDVQQPENASKFAFYALAFIAGLNVDRFIEKIEDIAQTTWGIKKSRVSDKNQGDNNDNN